MKNVYFVLDGRKPIPTDDVREWAIFFNNTKNRRVAQTTIGEYFVSTVFLGFDHSFTTNSTRPILFETMVFGAEDENDQCRYCTWEEAEAGHEKIVNELRKKHASNEH